MSQKFSDDEYYPIPYRCRVRGRQWLMFSAEYQNTDGRFDIFFHALSMEHAAAIVQEMKETLTLAGQVTGSEPG